MALPHHLLEGDKDIENPVALSGCGGVSEPTFG